MKSFLFLVGVIAFYLGVNYFSFTEGAIERWTEKTQFPNIESANTFCSMLTPESKIEFTYTINKRKPNLITTTDALCNYYKQRAIPNAGKHNNRLAQKIISHERIEKIPFNQAKSVIDINIGYKNDVIRKIDVELKRGLLGDFTILSIKGHDQITQEEKPRHRY